MLLRSRSLPDAIRTNLQKLILDQNAAALKQALKIAGEAPAPDAPPTGGLGVPRPGMPRNPASRPTLRQPSPPPKTPSRLPWMISEKALNAKPADPAAVARELWQNEFVEARGGPTRDQKTNPQQTLAAIGSIPLKDGP